MRLNYITVTKQGMSIYLFILIPNIKSSNRRKHPHVFEEIIRSKEKV